MIDEVNKVYLCQQLVGQCCSSSFLIYSRHQTIQYYLDVMRLMFMGVLSVIKLSIEKPIETNKQVSKESLNNLPDNSIL